MQQIGDWLEKLGMSEYGQCFADNKIDVSVLRHLTDQDLKDIGIPLGHRRKILAAITEMGTAPATPAATPATEPKPQDTAERRQVTVMFSDLVGSTALSVRMDPEDLREVISAYQKSVAQAVGRFGGFVAKYTGDGSPHRRDGRVFAGSALRDGDLTNAEAVSIISDTAGKGQLFKRACDCDAHCSAPRLVWVAFKRSTQFGHAPKGVSLRTWHE
jgi:class 3 adenylate cyclase